MVRRQRRRGSPPGSALLVRGAATACLLLGLAHPVLGQMPGVAVLQNAFANPGVTVGGFYGNADGSSAYGVAGAWAPRDWVQLTAGGGAFEVGESTRPAAGARAAVSLGRFVGFLRRESFGAALFGGYGWGGRDGLTASTIPLGLALGYRRTLGAARAISVYAAPFYARYQQSGLGLAETTGSFFRGSVGVDVALFRTVGLSIGWEGGAAADDASAGPRGSVFGAGVSYAFP